MAYTVDGQPLAIPPGALIVERQRTASGCTLVLELFNGSRVNMILDAPGTSSSPPAPPRAIRPARTPRATRERDRTPHKARGRRSRKAAPGELSCRVCEDNAVDTLLHPCRHAALCGTCARKLLVTTAVCPVCADSIDGLVDL